MSEEPTAAPPDSPTAGALLREARQARGLHLAALAASLKVSPARLEMIEHDRWNELPDLAYARALAHTVSRALGIDPQPVLRALPQAQQPRLEKIDEGLDEPYRESSSGRWRDWPWRRVLVVGTVAAGVLAAVAWGSRFGLPVSAQQAPAPGADTMAPAVAPAAPSPSSSPSGGAATGPSQSAAEVTPARLRVSASQASWVEVLDGQGRPLLSRVISEGEVVELPYLPPMSLTAGNAAVTAVWVDGRAVDLTAATRENVARLDLR
jgi:cytoskeleton protein RodZ